MFNRDRFILVHGACPMKWAKRWGIEPFTAPCLECGRDREAAIPFFVGRLRGLIATRCECGYGNAPYCVVRDWRHGDLFTADNG